MKLELQINNKIEKLAGYLANDSKKVCTEKNLKPLNELISQYLKELELNSQDSRARKFFKDMKYADLKKLWNESNTSVRIDIIEKVGDSFSVHTSKLDSYGGLRVGEIEDDIIRSDFGECEWMDHTVIEELIGKFLKPTPEDEEE